MTAAASACRPADHAQGDDAASHLQHALTSLDAMSAHNTPAPTSAAAPSRTCIQPCTVTAPASAATAALTLLALALAHTAMQLVAASAPLGASPSCKHCLWLQTRAAAQPPRSRVLP